MNFFFGLKNNFFNCELQIPLFQNRKIFQEDLVLINVTIQNNKWNFEKIYKKKKNDLFFYVENNDITNNNFFFISKNIDTKSFSKDRLYDYNNLTNTSPAYRANLKVVNNQGGFSSYQSEYPYNMVEKNGSILSSISSLTSKNSDTNYVILKNIFYKPINEKFDVYLIDINKNIIVDSFFAYTNSVNFYEIKKNLIKPEIFIFSKKYLAIPIYLSMYNSQISFEHTHPPHEYILSTNKFKIISKVKKNINEIVN